MDKIEEHHVFYHWLCLSQELLEVNLLTYGIGQLGNVYE